MLSLKTDSTAEVKTLVVFSIAQTIAILILVYLHWSEPERTSTEIPNPDYGQIDPPRPFQSYAESLDESDVRRIVRAELERFQGDLDTDVVERMEETGTAGEGDEEALLTANLYLAELIANGTIAASDIDTFVSKANALPPDERHRLFSKLADAVNSGTLEVLR